MFNSTTLHRYLLKMSQFLPLLLFCAALYLVHRQLQAHDLSEIFDTLQATPLWIIGLAFGLTVVNYLVLVGYDWLALRFTGHNNIPLIKMLAAALLSYAISNNTGHAWAAGGSIRYRFYSKWGVPGWDVIKISLFQTLTYLLGALTLGLIGSLILPYYLAQGVQEPVQIHWLSLVCTLTLLGYWLAVFFWRKPLLIKDFQLYLPTPQMAVWQTLIASADVVLSSLVLWVLLLGKLPMDFGAFLVVFVVAQVLGVISQVPGGIGVFESAFLWLMSDIENHNEHLVLIGALLLYRAVYYFLPLLLAGAGLLSYEIYSRRVQISESSLGLRRLLAATVPQLYALLLLFAGGVLLISGSIPANSTALDWLSQLPLPIIEFSHLIGSLIGLLLLFLSRGIRLKIDAAWYASILLLSLGIVVSLLKGLDWREALLLSVILLLMLPTRSHFQRQSSLLRMSFSKPWLASVAMVLAASIWIGLFAYQDVEYTHELWWQFSYDGNAPRFLRALLLLTVVCLCYGISRLLSIAPPQKFAAPSAAELEEARQLVQQCEHTEGFLALVGDKRLLWNKERTAFIMFATTSNYWIAMSDPVGAKSAIENLLWQFRELADQYGAKPVFYQVSPEFLPFYLDLGLSLFKLGEAANVELAGFNLQGKHRVDLRSSINKFTKLAYRFEVLAAAELETALPRLREISDAWLAHKHTREKGFSLGYFSEAYLRRTGVAVIKDETGRIMAFANLFQTINHQELSIDLMRYHPDSPKGIMDFLFAELLLWGQAEQYRWFSLGMAPLAGLERRPLAPLWHKLGTAIFDLGEQFYNFEGLYAYKEKFSPQWQPHYLAAPAGISAPLILLSIARLIANGWRGMLAK